jgi:hypothetical protein
MAEGIAPDLAQEHPREKWRGEQHPDPSRPRELGGAIASESSTVRDALNEKFSSAISIPVRHQYCRLEA